MATRYIDNPTIKRLFAESKGICARCDVDLFPNGDLIGEVCHIEAYSPGGNRYNKSLKKSKKENNYENLIVLCSNCHLIIDKKENEDIYNKDYLLNLKKAHLLKFLSNQKCDLTDNDANILSAKFTQSIETELQEIKTILKSIISNYSFSLTSDVFNRKNNFEPSLNYIGSFYYSKEDIEIIDTIVKGTELEQPQSYILIGPPSSGKTTLVLKLTSQLPNLFTHFYISLKNDFQIENIRKDLKYIRSFQAVVFVDDCHLNNNLACEIFYECENLTNLTLIFNYREIDDIAKVSDNGYNLFNETVSQIFYVDPFSNQGDKIHTLINSRKKKIQEKQNFEPQIGDIKIIEKLINKNLLKLTLLLDEWEKQPDKLLASITDHELNKLLYKRFLSSRYHYSKQEIDNLKLYTTVNTYEIPFKIFDKTNLEVELLTDALINLNKESEYQFFHSSFAKLLLLSIIASDSNFSVEFPDGFKQLEKFAVKTYFKHLSEKSNKGYPHKIALSLNKIVANRGFELFKFLTRDNEIKLYLVNYFKSANDNEQYLKFFKNINNYCKDQFEYYYNQIIDTGKLSEILNSQPKNIIDVKTSLVILRNKSYSKYKLAVQNLPKETIKQIILSSNLNDVTYTLRYVSDFDKPFAQILIRDISPEEWKAFINNHSLSIISNSIIELKQLTSREFASKVLSSGLNSEIILNASKREPIEKLTKSIKEINQINEGISKNIAASITEDFLYQKIQNQPIGKISKSLKELYPYKGIELSSIVAKINSAELIKEFENYNLSNIGRILSELYDINNKQIKSITLDDCFQNLLLAKLSIETNSGQVGKIIADLKKIEPKAAKLFLSSISFDKIENLVNSSSVQQLAEFLYNIFLNKGFEQLIASIYKEIPAKHIVAKTTHSRFIITNYESPFSQFALIDKDKTIEVLNAIANPVIFNKCLNYRVNVRKVSQALKSLNCINSEKINSITSELLANNEFLLKIADSENSSKIDFIHCYANFLEINKNIKPEIFYNRILKFTAESLRNEDVSAYSDGLKLLNENITLTKDHTFIKSFEEHLIKNYSHFKLRQISIAFINLFSIDKPYASKLIEKLTPKILAKKALEIDSKENLNGCLGEIKKVNSNFYQSIIKEIQKLNFDN